MSADGLIGTSPTAQRDAIPPSTLMEQRNDLGTSPEDFTSLVLRMQDGDEAAFVTVYRIVQPPLLRYLSVLVGAEAEDVASETWAQACRDLRKFHGDGDGFRGWVTTIGRHRALDYLRAKGRRPIADVRLDALQVAPQTVDAETSALEAMSTAEAIELIATLPRDQAEAVLLRSVLGLDASSAGKVLGKRAGAVRTATYRGLRTLAERLNTTGSGAGDESDPSSAEEAS
jgi:RNA polymerase sigma-70 factor (ECF subfamily)